MKKMGEAMKLNEEYKEEVKMLMERLNDATVKLEQMNIVAKDLTKSWRELKDKILEGGENEETNKYSAQLDNLKERNNELARRISQLEAELEEARKRLEALMSKHKILTTSESNTTTEIVRENNVDFEELERLKRTISDFEAQLSQLKADNLELESISNYLDEQVKELTKQVRQKNKFMKEKLKDLSKVIDSCRHTQIHSLDRLVDIFTSSKKKNDE